MHYEELPPALCYLYDKGANRPKVLIDLGRCVVVQQDGHETPLVGQVYRLLALLLESPGRVWTYQQLAFSLMPAYADRRYRGEIDLDPDDQEAATRAMQTLVYRARLALGERPGSPSLVVNREGIGYAIQRPCCVMCSHDLTGGPHR